MDEREKIHQEQKCSYTNPPGTSSLSDIPVGTAKALVRDAQIFTRDSDQLLNW